MPIRVRATAGGGLSQGGLPGFAGQPAWLLALAASVASVFMLAVVIWAIGSMAHNTSDMRIEIELVKAFIAKGQFASAGSAAEGYLGQANPEPNGTAKVTLASLWYVASLDSLLATPHKDPDSSRDAGNKWLEIEGTAGRLNLPREARLAPMVVAQRAYNAGLWPLAYAAFKEAWGAGSVGRGSVGFAYASLRNRGNELAFWPGSTAETREEGSRLLSTAHTIALAYGVENREALGDLKRLGYDECCLPVPDVSDPVLASARK